MAIGPLLGTELWGHVVSRKNSLRISNDFQSRLSRFQFSRGCATFRAFMWLQLHGADQQKRWKGRTRTAGGRGKMGNFFALILTWLELHKQPLDDYDITPLGSNSDMSECIHCTVLFLMHHLWHVLLPLKKTFRLFFGPPHRCSIGGPCSFGVPLNWKQQQQLKREKAMVRRRKWAGRYSNLKKYRNEIDHSFSRNLLLCFFC